MFAPRLANARRRQPARVAHVDLPGLEVELGAQQDLERNRLRPEVAADLELDDVVRIEHARRLERAHDQALGEDARLEVDDGLADPALEHADVELRPEL